MIFWYFFIKEKVHKTIIVLPFFVYHKKIFYQNFTIFASGFVLTMDSGNYHISPDRLVQNPALVGSYNRYTYCGPARPQRSEGGNNPLSCTDPSGWSYKFVKPFPDMPDGGVGYCIDRFAFRGYDGPGSGYHWSDAYSMVASWEAYATSSSSGVMSYNTYSWLMSGGAVDLGDQSGNQELISQLNSVFRNASGSVNLKLGYIQVGSTSHFFQWDPVANIYYIPYIGISVDPISYLIQYYRNPSGQGGRNWADHVELAGDIGGQLVQERKTS